MKYLYDVCSTFMRASWVTLYFVGGQFVICRQITDQRASSVQALVSEPSFAKARSQKHEISGRTSCFKRSTIHISEFFQDMVIQKCCPLDCWIIGLAPSVKLGWSGPWFWSCNSFGFSFRFVFCFFEWRLVAHPVRLTPTPRVNRGKVTISSHCFYPRDLFHKMQTAVN